MSALTSTRMAAVLALAAVLVSGKCSKQSTGSNPRSCRRFSDWRCAGALAARSRGVGHRVKALQGPPEAPSAGAIPKQCMDPGLNLQSACDSEIQKAAKAFGLKFGAASSATPALNITIDQAKIDAYVADPTNTISPGCCKAAVVFNTNRCSCDANVLQLVKSFTNNDITVYSQVAQALATACKFPLIYGQSC